VTDVNDFISTILEHEVSELFCSNRQSLRLCYIYHTLHTPLQRHHTSVMVVLGFTATPRKVSSDPDIV
jgi:hypothetical protein